MIEIVYKELSYKIMKINLQKIVKRFQVPIKMNIRTFVPRFGHSGSTLNNRQTSNFCSQLKMLLASGMPLVDALSIMKDLFAKQRNGVQFDRVITEVTNGHALSESVAGLLPHLAVASLCAAENAGNLEETLGQLADFFRSKAELEEKLKGALVYPCFVLALSFLIIVGLFVFILPGFNGLFSDLGVELPLPTKILLSIGNYWYLFIAASLFSILFIRRNLLCLPVVGRLYRQEEIIQSLGSLGSLLRGGVPMLEALQTVSESARSERLKRIMREVSVAVQDGEKLSAALAASGFFPSEAIQMLRVGESSGQLSEMLLAIGEFQAREREEYLKRITSLIEPTMTLSVGMIVAAVVMAVFLPLINMISSLQ